jgi:hypothetical protein
VAPKETCLSIIDYSGVAQKGGDSMIALAGIFVVALMSLLFVIVGLSQQNDDRQRDQMTVADILASARRIHQRSHPIRDLRTEYVRYSVSQAYDSSADAEIFEDDEIRSAA